MKIWSDIKRNWINVYLFKGFFSPFLLFKEAIKFPTDYLLRNGKSSSILNINLMLTLKCNLKCKPCYNHARINKPYEDLDLNTVKKLLSEIENKKIIFFLTGGEPFLNKDVFKIIKNIKEKGHYCGICTNGNLLNKKTLSKLIQLKLDTLVLSLHGYDNIHNEITGNKKSFKKIIDSLKILKESNEKPYTVINLTISKKSLNKFDELIKTLKPLKLDSLRLNHLSFLTKKDFKKHKKVFRKKFPDEKFEIISYIPDFDYGNIPNKFSKLKKQGLNKNTSFILKPRLNEEELRKWYSEKGIIRKCYFIWRALFIQPNGEVHPCEYIPVKMGNIKHQNIWTIWNNQRYLKIRRLIKKEQFPVCKRCCKL